MAELRVAFTEAVSEAAASHMDAGVGVTLAGSKTSDGPLETVVSDAAGE